MDELLRGLDPSQREAVTSAAAPLAILAGPGSGKTRVLTRRIAWQARQEQVDPRHVLAVTFTRKAAGELRTRLQRLGVQHAVTAGTFHGIALAQLRRRADDHHRAMPAVLERKVRLLAPMLRLPGREAGLVAAELASEIEWAKARLVRPDAYEHAVAVAGRTPPRPPAQVAEVYREYERQKRRRGLLDFDDLILDCARAFEDDTEFAAVQRWRFRYLFVDEFQDASPAQFRLLTAWLGDGSDLCVVGDADQAIYGFAGADASYLGRFVMHFPSSRHPKVGVVELEHNYRSSPQVVAAAHAVLGAPARRTAPRAKRPEGPAPTVITYDTDRDEAAGVARALRSAHAANVSWSRLAVLYRVNAQSALFEEALARARVPFRVRGATRFLERPEVKVTLDALREAARTAPGRSLVEHLADLADADGRHIRSEEEQEHVDALLGLGHEYLDAEGGGGSLDGFLAFLAATLRGDDADPAGSDAVELLTFHRAKGLEFDTVFVTGLERGLVPISHAKTPEALGEEQRLLYVALSRAERGLHVSWAKQRTIGLHEAARRPSPWLARLERTIERTRLAETGAGVDPRERIAATRARLNTRNGSARAVPEAAEPLFTALVDWRRRLSRAAGTPAYVVFSNATLAAIAVARPRTRGSLLAVPGVGPVKAERYGEAVLALVAEHAP
jgi:DNA helicase-2/ATP-dependent DNA helicase PcrA